MWSLELAVDHGERVRALRTYANGTLPLFDRYVAGEHIEAWEALRALGPEVRRDPHAADALAVAYETMQRVERNVRTIVTRLGTLGYRFTTPDGTRRAPDSAHRPPGRAVRRHFARLEKATGMLPISLRVFLEVVGSVDLVGEFGRDRGDDAAIASDPLVVVPLDDLLAQVDAWDEREDSVIVAPDDLHKAGVSGGDPYEIGVPDEAADGVLLNERHGLPLRRVPAPGAAVRRVSGLRGRGRSAAGDRRVAAGPGPVLKESLRSAGISPRRARRSRPARRGS